MDILQTYKRTALIVLIPTLLIGDVGAIVDLIKNPRANTGAELVYLVISTLIITGIVLYFTAKKEAEISSEDKDNTIKGRF